jgi:hypothetical protein
VFEQFSMPLAISDSGESLDLIGVAFLLLHLDAAHPQEAPQLPPLDRHLHFIVLHKEFLLHAQQTVDAVLDVTTVEFSDADVLMSSTDLQLLLPTDIVC